MPFIMMPCYDVPPMPYATSSMYKKTVDEYYGILMMPPSYVQAAGNDYS